MDNEEYYQYFKKYVELRDQKMNREAYEELNKPLVEELGVIEASQIQNTADWDYALLKAKRYTETKAQLTKEELEELNFEDYDIEYVLDNPDEELPCNNAVAASTITTHMFYCVL